MKRPLAANDPRHGTLNGYNNHRCRCSACREAARTYHEERRRRYGIPTWAEHVAALGGRTHGAISTYHAGCRCAACRRAAADARARSRQKARRRDEAA